MHVGAVAAAGLAAVAPGHVGGGGEDVEPGHRVDIGELPCVERSLVGIEDALALGVVGRQPARVGLGEGPAVELGAEGHGCRPQAGRRSCRARSRIMATSSSTGRYDSR